MKRSIAILTALVWMFAMVGCSFAGAGGETAKTAGPTDAHEADSSSNTGKDRIKIGVSIWSYTDALGTDCYNMLTAAAQALDIDLESNAQGFDTDATLNGIENMISAGCDGIIVCNSSDGIMPSIAKSCDANGVYLAQFFRNIEDPDVRSAVTASDYFLGCTHEDEYNTGYKLGMALAEKGINKVGYISWNHGDTTAEARYKGYIDAFAEADIQILAEQWEINTAEDGTKTAETMMNAYPEMEAIIVAGGSGEPLAGTVTAVKNMDKVAKVLVVSTDFLSTLHEDFDSGLMGAMSGGHFCDPLFSLMLVYNTIASQGSFVSEPAEIKMDMVFVSSIEDVEAYEQAFVGDVLPYTAEEIQAMSVAHTEGVTLQTLVDTAKALSLQDVLARHASLLE